MSNVFGNSWLTICTPAANSCLEGFLDHTDRHAGTIEIEYVEEESQEARGSFFLRLLTLNGKPGFSDDGRLAVLPPLQRDLGYSEWNMRGWVFQEKVLSPRLLYFGARMIHFQRDGYIISENGFSTHGDFFDLKFDTRRNCTTNLLHQLQVIKNQGSFITDFWYRLVTVINPSNFTDRRDTLPAITGIARRVHEFTKHRYLAGLWEEDLCCGLLWSPAWTDEPLKSQFRPTSLRQLLKLIKKADLIAPSWSWASRRCLLEYEITNQNVLTCRVRRHLRADFKILQSRVRVDGVNTYGRIESASISLTGATMRLLPHSLAPTYRTLEHLQCEILPGLWAFVHTDWFPIKSKATGVKKQMRVQFQLLLISSCCSDWNRSSDNPTAQSGPHSERAGSKAVSTESSSGSWSRHKTPPAIWNASLRPKYMESFYEDSHPGFDAAVHCHLCSDHTLRRDVWGLLIYPAGPPDTYYRVGTFFSRAQHGGSAIFDRAEPRRIELV